MGKARKFQVIFLSVMMLSSLLLWNYRRYPFVDYNVSVKPAPIDGSRTISYNSPCGCSRNLTISSVENSEGFQWCSQESLSRGSNQKVVSFSLFESAEKDKLRYFPFLRDIVIRVNQVLPGWIVRLHHTIESENKDHELLCDVYCNCPWMDLCDVSALWRKLSKRTKKTKADLRPVIGEQIFNLNRRMWRFLPFLDPQVDVILTRDIDASIIDREVVAVQQWLQSNYTFHVMRDHQSHKTHILAGLFGAKIHLRRDLIAGLTKVIINYGQNQKYGTDQSLLSKVFWPSVKHDVMAHDSYNCMESWNALPTFPFPTQRANDTFVSDNIGRHWIRPEKCPIQCRPPENPDWEYC